MWRNTGGIGNGFQGFAKTGLGLVVTALAEWRIVIRAQADRNQRIPGELPDFIRGQHMLGVGFGFGDLAGLEGSLDQDFTLIRSNRDQQAEQIGIGPLFFLLGQAPEINVLVLDSGDDPVAEAPRLSPQPQPSGYESFRLTR